MSPAYPGVAGVGRHLARRRSRRQPAEGGGSVHRTATGAGWAASPFVSTISLLPLLVTVNQPAVMAFRGNDSTCLDALHERDDRSVAGGGMSVGAHPHLRVVVRVPARPGGHDRRVVVLSTGVVANLHRPAAIRCSRRPCRCASGGRGSGSSGSSMSPCMTTDTRRWRRAGQSFPSTKTAASSAASARLNELSDFRSCAVCDLLRVDERQQRKREGDQDADDEHARHEPPAPLLAQAVRGSRLTGAPPSLPRDRPSSPLGSRTSRRNSYVPPDGAA